MRTDQVTSESSCEGRSFVLKPAARSIFELSHDLKYEFGDSSRIRTQVDEIEGQDFLVYEYFKDNLLSLAKNNEDLPIEARKVILRELGLCVKDLHCKIGYTW